MRENPFELFCKQWEPLLNRHLSSNKVRGLQREDLKQELLLVMWECFTKDCDIRHTSTYISKSLHNRITELYADAQEFYYPSTNLRCISCGAIVHYKPDRCTNCEGTRWRKAKGQEITILPEDVPFIEEFYIQERDTPQEINHIVDNIFSGKKTGLKQKQKLRDYLRYERIH